MDERWEFQLHKPLHVTAYYVNPHYHYSQNFLVNANIKIRLYNYIKRVVPDLNERCNIDMQLKSFKDVRGLFGIEATKLARDKKAQAKWWDSYGAECPELEKFVIQVLSLTYSSSGFHAKRRNCLHQKKMNDLVFVMHNLKLKDRKAK
ncbi:hypothetical protein P3X46_005709 [Hevea brasiliensis]|uniref:HAT C-terminal dimerisation domain-containing protein n=1 Tax=Hevea brasiliensis TaxID=3981 RepID=A0ABQ9N3A0_HEVBR|nr:hypothetical protein P3X46_005709 [Hevea brasiliensis]